MNTHRCSFLPPLAGKNFSQQSSRTTSLANLLRERFLTRIFRKLAEVNKCGSTVAALFARPRPPTAGGGDGHHHRPLTVRAGSVLLEPNDFVLVAFLPQGRRGGLFVAAGVLRSAGLEEADQPLDCFVKFGTHFCVPPFFSFFFLLLVNPPSVNADGW